MLGDAIGGVAQGAGDIGAAAINQSTQEADAKEAAQAQEDLSKQNFLQETGYDSNQQQALRDAILGVSAQGNPYAQAQQYLQKPNGSQSQAPTFGGGSYANGQAAPANPAQGGLAAGITANPNQKTGPVARPAGGAPAGVKI